MTKIVGHRGARNLWPENSLTGFRNILALDVDAIEFDVHLTDEGELVVIHDATLDRTTDNTGPVRALTTETRARTHLEGSADIVPTLADVLSVLAEASDKQFHVEIKSAEDKRPYPGITEKVVAEIERFGLAERCYLTSFDVSVLEECRQVAPHIARLVSVNAQWADKQGGLEKFLQSVDGLAEFVAIHHELLSQNWSFISAQLPLHRLCVWTLNDEALIRPWLERGIGHLTSDSPDLALRLRLGIQSQKQPA
ncbi:glycerophosphodiester phosphodiesterase family protein [Agrobacterium larrymoorei]|uniref:Glycerophosphodiester phosphodiesterase family protein n=1 Tax=Agrobacterium larrymoorei TaxID=160699 RepID=A0AAF0HDH5_9HYPH|nr:glycerophosphodiester phosphodiesterase family protein [Agrobacterium larrymoorei]WHA44048.1 glycerophosphodiester phosphodiesterase family protein [Agrobacterium larrymoorei]